MLDLKEPFGCVTDETWLRLAEPSKIEIQTLKRRFRAFVENHPIPVDQFQVRTGEVRHVGDSTERDFEISIFKLLGIKGWMQFRGPSDNWTARCHAALLLLGGVVYEFDFTLSPEEASVSYDVDLTLVKATLTFALGGDKHCFWIGGRACYYWVKWNCKKFDQKLFCFG